MQMEPLGHESCSDGRSDTPRRYGGHGKILGERFRKELHHGPGNATNLHPAFENRAPLLPEVIDAPPAFQVMEEGFDLPTVAIEGDDFRGGQIGFGSEIKACGRPSMVFCIVESAPDCPDGMAVEEACLDDDGLKTDFLPFPINKQGEYLRGE